MIKRFGSIFAVVFLCTPAAVMSQEYDVYNLTEICGFSSATINNAGIVVGLGERKGLPFGMTFDANGCRPLDALRLPSWYDQHAFNYVDPIGINDRGQFVGRSGSARGIPGTDSEHHFMSPVVSDELISGHPPRRLTLKRRGVEGIARSINNDGLIVGSLFDIVVDPFFSQPFVFDRRSRVQLLRLHRGDVGGEALDVNDRNEAVGYSGARAPIGENGFTIGSRPTLWREGSVNRLPLAPGLSFGRANDINNYSVAVGMGREAVFGPGAEALLWEADGSVRILPGRRDESQVPYPHRQFNGFATAINDCGAVVGATGGDGAVIWTASGERYSLGALAGFGQDFDVNLMKGDRINNQGQIIAQSMRAVFLLNPRAGSSIAHGCETLTATYPPYKMLKPRSTKKSKAKGKKTVRQPTLRKKA